MYYVFTDGASFNNPGPAGIGFVVFDNEHNIIFKYSKPIGIASNNVAEYTAVIEALKFCIKNNYLECSFNADSNLVVQQVNDNWKINNLQLKKLYKHVKLLIKSLDSFSIKYIPREKNTIADELSKNGAKNNKE